MMKHFMAVVGMTLMVGTLVLLSGCGEKESQGGLLGATTGAVLGSAVAGHGSRGEGAVIGGLAGALIGSSIGRASDEKDTEKRHVQEVGRLQSEKRTLERQLDRWCGSCGRMVKIRGAQSCPDCGGELIQEKFCDRCKATFTPDAGYQFCPYCKVKTKLQNR